MHEHTEGLDKLKAGMMPLKRSWKYTYFLFVEENLFLFWARRSLWNNNFPIMLHMTITVLYATFCNYLTSLCCSFIICKREMIIVPPSVECMMIKQLLTLTRSLVYNSYLIIFFCMPHGNNENISS